MFFLVPRVWSNHSPFPSFCVNSPLALPISRAQDLRKKQWKVAKQKNIQMREREAHRIAVRQDVNGGRERRIRELQHQMHQRESMIARAKAQKQRERELRREDEMLRQQDRLEAVERMRRMAEYKKMMTIKKIREDEERTRKVCSCCSLSKVV